jgi:hypothetical protein
LQFLHYCPSEASGSKEFAMKTGKSARDLLVDQTSALVKAAIDHDVGSSSTARVRPNPTLGNEIAAEKIGRTERGPLVEDILSLIVRVSCNASNADGTGWEGERLKIADDIDRMATELNTLRGQVNDFKERQQRLRQERDAATDMAKEHGTYWNSPEHSSS